MSSDYYKGGRTSMRSADTQESRRSNVNMTSTFARPRLGREIAKHLDNYILITLEASQLNILGQVFRPIMCGTVAEVTTEYVMLKNVNIKMSNAPEFIFPTPLIIPLRQIVWFMPFDCQTRLSLY